MCAQCGTGLSPGDFFCSGCGTPVPGGRHEGWVTLEFRGTVSQAYIWVTWFVLLSLLVIPTGWGIASLARWYVRNLGFSDGSRAWFEGTGWQIWWYYVVLGVLGVLRRYYLVVFLPSIFAEAWVNLTVLRWFVGNTRLSSGAGARFTGSYWPFLGFSVLLTLSIFTIIGWAWVLAGFMEWICRHLFIGDRQGAFHGSALHLLWRGFAALLGSLPIVTIPWMWVWFVKWLTGRVAFREPDTSAGCAW